MISGKVYVGLNNGSFISNFLLMVILLSMIFSLSALNRLASLLFLLILKLYTYWNGFVFALRIIYRLYFEYLSEEKYSEYFPEYFGVLTYFSFLWKNENWIISILRGIYIKDMIWNLFLMLYLLLYDCQNIYL